jgi:hypothetical protein
MLLDRGLNDRWIRPKHLRRLSPGKYAATLIEPLDQSWPREIIAYPLPPTLRGQAVQVTLGSQPVLSQVSGADLFILVENLAPGETRVYEISAETHPRAPKSGVKFSSTREGALLTNGVISLKLP